MIDPQEWLQKNEAMVWYGGPGFGVVVAVPQDTGDLIIAWGQDLDDAVEGHVLSRTEILPFGTLRRTGFMPAVREAAMRSRERRLRDAS